jgi:hypothetical protein
MHGGAALAQAADQLKTFIGRDPTRYDQQDALSGQHGALSGSSNRP